MLLTKPVANKAMASITEDEFRLLRGMVYDESGLWLGEEKKSFIEQRAFKRMKALNVASFIGYYILLNDKERGRDELLTFLDCLTINETSFFRNKPQFSLFSDIVLPEVISAKRADNSLSIRIWSAGCSTGQEPYTISMILHELIPDIRNWRIKILATDLSLSALETAQTGFYAAERMHGLEQRHVTAYFRKTAGGYTVIDDVRRPITFERHNLMNECVESDFDFIFCRNVLIYFDDLTQKKVIGGFERGLLPGGWLFLGHSESLQGICSNFEFFHINKGTAYRKQPLPQGSVDEA